MASKRQKKAGYLLPEQIEDHPLICVSLKIPDVEEYRAAFIGALYTLAQWWSWEKSFDGGDTRARDAATYWRKLLLEEMCMPAVCPIDLRQNPFDPCEIQKTTDGVTWVTAWRDDLCITELPIPITDTLAALQQNLYETNYNGNPSSINPNAPDDFFSEAGLRAEALCMAVQSWVATIASQFVDKARVALGLSVFAIIAAGFLGPLGAAAGVLVGASLLLVSAAAVDAAQDSEAINDVMCCMIAGLSGDVINHANFQNALASCGFTGGSHQQIFADVVNEELAVEANYLAFLDLLGKGYVLAQAGVVCEDPCDAWQHTFYSTGNPRLPDENIIYGDYDATNNWLYSTWALDPTHHDDLSIWGAVSQAFTQDVNVKRVKMTYQTVVNNPFSSRSGNIQSSAHGVLANIQTTNSGTYTVDTGEIDIVVPSGGSLSWWYTQRSSGNGGDIVRLKSITVYGQGFDPFV